MKIKVKKPVEIEIKTLRLSLPVRYEEEDMPNNFPLRNGDVWEADIDVDEGRITNWPRGQSGEFYMKVCDSGVYTLLDPAGAVVAKLEGEYVPQCAPGDDDDYVGMKIEDDGRITNWDFTCDFEDFFPDKD